jgi:hypothetical protein
MEVQAYLWNSGAYMVFGEVVSYADAYGLSVARVKRRTRVYAVVPPDTRGRKVSVKGVLVLSNV